MIFTPISSSSAGNLYIVESPGSRFLGMKSRRLGAIAIECGLCFSKMRGRFFLGVPPSRINFLLTDLDGVLLSHSHGDHGRAAKDVLRAGIPIYALAETFRELKLDGHHNAHAVKPLEHFTIKGRWRVLPFGLRHDVACLGFLIQVDEEKLLYITDTAYVPHRFNDVTIIAIEANYSESALWQSEAGAARKMRALRSHMSIERVVEFLRLNDLTSVREIHLLHLSDSHSDADQFRRFVQEQTGKPTYIAAKG